METTATQALRALLATKEAELARAKSEAARIPSLSSEVATLQSALAELAASATRTATSGVATPKQQSLAAVAPVASAPAPDAPRRGRAASPDSQSERAIALLWSAGRPMKYDELAEAIGADGQSLLGALHRERAKPNARISFDGKGVFRAKAA